MDIGIPESIITCPESIAEIVSTTNATPQIGRLTEFDERSVDIVLVEGNIAYGEAIKADLDIPLLPMATTPCLEPIQVANLTQAITDLLQNNGEYVDRLGLMLSNGELDATAYFSVLIGTSEAAAISEFSVRTASHSLGQYRADGIIVSAPSGTNGYPHAAGSSRIGPNVTALSVIPLSAYQTTSEHWTVDSSGVTVEVLREETPVSVFADTRMVGSLSPNEPLTIRGEQIATTVRVPDSISPFPP